MQVQSYAPDDILNAELREVSTSWSPLMAPAPLWLFWKTIFFSKKYIIVLMHRRAYERTRDKTRAPAAAPWAVARGSASAARSRTPSWPRSFVDFYVFFRYFRSTFLSPVGGTLALDISNSRLGNKTVVYSAITRSIAVMLRPRRLAQMALSSEV